MGNHNSKKTMENHNSDQTDIERLITDHPIGTPLKDDIFHQATRNRDCGSILDGLGCNEISSKKDVVNKKLEKNRELSVKKPIRYTKESTEYLKKIWELFCESHGLSTTTEYEEVAYNKKFFGKALLCWDTDVCDILKYREGGRFIIRRKNYMLKI